MRDKPRSWRRVGVGVGLGACLILLAGVAFRLWVNWSPAEEAPQVLLSIGADWMNDIGLHQASYQAVVTRLGGSVHEVSPRDKRSPEELLAGMDALLLTGGGDVDPQRYGGDPQRAKLVDAERDDFEEALIRAALARDMPVLAVCRGHQLLNVMFGGSLKDIRGDKELSRTHGISARSLVAHPVEYSPSSHVQAAAGAAQGKVNSFHGQVIGRLGQGLRATAVSADGVVEAVEVEGVRYAVGVQWHPELAALGDPAARQLFQDFLTEARAYRQRRLTPR